MNLGVMYERGQGVTLNKAQAVALFQKACDAGDDDGCFRAEMGRKR
jgi:TPR repeat protein